MLPCFLANIRQEKVNNQSVFALWCGTRAYQGSSLFLGFLTRERPQKEGRLAPWYGQPVKCVVDVNALSAGESSCSEVNAGASSYEETR